MLLALLLAQVLPANPEGPIFTNPAAMGRYAFFEAFPSSGAGTSGACSTTPPTGAKGEALTFARTGNATCTRTASGGLATTGIANGDLVVMSADQPRVEYDSAGTLGLLVESSRTNYVLRSQELANGVWVALGAGGAAAPTVTATYATGPDNGTTATRVQVNACAGVSQASVVYQNYTGTAAAFVGAPYLRGTSGSGTINVYFYDTTAGTGNAVQCSFVADSWTRCAPVSKAFANTTHRIGFGCLNDAVVTSSTNTGATDVLIYGAQSEPGTYLTSYIPTTSAAVTRNAETATFDLGAGSPLRAESMSMALTHTLSGLNPGIQGVMNVNAGSSGATSGTDSMWAYFSSGGSLRCLASVASATGTVTLVTTPARTWCSSTASSVSGSSNGVAMASSGAPTPGAQPARWVNVGASPFPYQNDGVFSRVCVDPVPTRCR